MLVLSRKPGEVVVIRTPEGAMMKVLVLEIRGDRVRLGIEAPEAVAVNRHEVDEVIQAAIATAARAGV